MVSSGKRFPGSRRFYQEMFSFYESLGAYYEEKGYEEISHSRLRRYEILLEFLKEKTQLPVNTAISAYGI